MGDNNHLTQTHSSEILDSEFYRIIDGFIGFHSSVKIVAQTADQLAQQSKKISIFFGSASQS